MAKKKDTPAVEGADVVTDAVTPEAPAPTPAPKAPAAPKVANAEEQLEQVRQIAHGPSATSIRLGRIADLVGRPQHPETSKPEKALTLEQRVKKLEAA